MKIHYLKMLSGAIVLATAISNSVLATEAKEIFVDPINGSIKGTAGLDGSISNPFKKVKDAINFAEAKYNRGATRFPYTIQLRAGTYDEVVTRSGMKGTIDRPITIQAYQDEQVTFDGTIDATGGWVAEGDNIYSRHIGKDVWQLFVLLIFVCDLKTYLQRMIN